MLRDRAVAADAVVDDPCSLRNPIRCPNTRPSPAPTNRTLPNILPLAPPPGFRRGPLRACCRKFSEQHRPIEAELVNRRVQRRLVLQPVVPMDLVEIESDAGITISPAHAGGANGHWVARDRVVRATHSTRNARRSDGIDRLDPLRFVDDVPRENLGLLAVALEQGAQHQVEERVATRGIGEHVRCGRPSARRVSTLAGSHHKKSRSTNMILMPLRLAMSSAASTSLNTKSSSPCGRPPALNRMPARPSQKRNHRTYRTPDAASRANVCSSCARSSGCATPPSGLHALAPKSMP